MRFLRSKAQRATRDPILRSFREHDHDDEQPAERRRKGRDRQRARQRAEKVARVAGRNPLGGTGEIAAGRRLMRGW